MTPHEQELLDATVDLPYLKPPLSMNDRMHWALRATWTRRLRDDAILLARKHRLPKGLSQVGIALHWQATTRRRRDSDNPAPTLKALVDGLVVYGLVADDDSGHVTSGCVIEAVASEARLWLRIVELTARAA
ncbi:MAG TPA: hypothetical protein VFW64_12480 [Pseudonocardiaceae bacterium]|nr:hypothetical protein [Pseudonocardiaceae bacterium]